MSHPPTIETRSDQPVDGTQRNSRTLILCFDGTSDQYDKANTNVVKLYSLFNQDHTGEQLCYYQAGVGTYTQPGITSSLFSWAAKTVDKAFAWYLYEHILDGYRFLMRNYNAGDRVCLFGFSRGAYTARALAGMLHKVGLLAKDNTEQVQFAYTLYESDDVTLVNGFKKTFCRQVPIDFVGVWDTVASTGVVMSKSLPFVDVNTTIRVFRQALALDEHRVRFRAKYYQRRNPKKTTKKTTAGSDPSIEEEEEEEQEEEDVLKEMENESKIIPPETDEKFDKTDVKEVWFIGSHADVGGGMEEDKEPHPLSNISLRWMVREIVYAGVKVLFDQKTLKDMNMLSMVESLSINLNPTESPQTPHPETNGTLINRKKGNGNGDQRLPPPAYFSLDVEDVEDVKKKITDQLVNKRIWKILEWYPSKFTWVDENGVEQSKRDRHQERGRWVPPRPVFHRSVKLCMEQQGYEPKAKYKEPEVGKISYVY